MTRKQQISKLSSSDYKIMQRVKNQEIPLSKYRGLKTVAHLELI